LSGLTLNCWLITHTKKSQPVQKEATMTEISTTKKGSKQADDNTIRPFPNVNVAEADLTELRRRIDNTRWPERETVTERVL
jgi:hypothetical protein